MVKKSKRVSISTSRQYGLFSGKQEIVTTIEQSQDLSSNTQSQKMKTSATATYPPSGGTPSQSTENDFAGLQCHAVDLINALWLYRQGRKE